MKKLFLIFSILIFCNIGVCIAQRSIQQDFMGGLNSGGGKNHPDNYVLNLQASKKEWEKILSDLRLQLYQHRSTTKPSNMSQEDWDKEEEALLINIEHAKRNISQLNKQINKAKAQQDELSKAVDKAVQEAANKQKEKEIREQLQKTQQELNDAKQKAKAITDPVYKQYHNTVDQSQEAVTYGNEALRSVRADNASGFVPTSNLNIDSRQTVPPRGNISSKFSQPVNNEQQVQQEGENKNSDEQIQELLKKIEELKKQLDELERLKKEKEREQKTKKNQ